jgi:hypothetical protein
VSEKVFLLIAYRVIREAIMVKSVSNLFMAIEPLVRKVVSFNNSHTDILVQLHF